MMNPGMMMKLMNGKAQFESRHPKFSAFFNAMLASGVSEGTILEVTIKRPGEDPVTSNMMVMKEDLELAEDLKNLGQ